jgi:hypothetical protein
MNKLLIFALLLLFFIPLTMSADWCEYNEIERHSSNTSIGNWIDTESSYFNNDVGEWSGLCSRTLFSGCPFGVTNPCLMCGTSSNVLMNYTIPFSYCPNLTVSLYHKSSQSLNKFNLTICNNAYSVDSSNAYETNTIKTNLYVDTSTCPLRNLAVSRDYWSAGVMYYDNFTVSCNFQNSQVGGTYEEDEFFSAPEYFSGYMSLPNETYPNVTYKTKMSLTDFIPVCSDEDTLNKYGYYVNTISTRPDSINWIVTTPSCIDYDEERIASLYSNSGLGHVFGGCRALVNYQDATLNCNLIKYNTSIGIDVPTLTIISPINDSSVSLNNPISFSVNMSNTKCQDVYVLSTNIQTNYNKLTILSSTDNLYYNGSETLPNGTYTSKLICLDGCVGSSSHNVTEEISFSISTEYISGGGTIHYYNSSSCVSEWVNLGGLASCYPNPIDIPDYCSNIEIKETARVEYDNYLTSCDSDGGVFNNGQFNITACVPLNNCGSSNRYCNETSITKVKTYSGEISGQVLGYSQAFVPIDCSCPSSLLGWEYSRKIKQFRVYGTLTFECDKSCRGEWICSSSKQKAYMNEDCDLTNITYCSYMCKDGECIDIGGGITGGGVVDTVDSATFIFLNFLLKPNPTQKFLTAMFVSITLGFIGFSFASGHGGSSHSGLIFIIMFMVGFSFFTFMGYIPSVLIILMLFGVGGYVLLKNVV